MGGGGVPKQRQLGAHLNCSLGFSVMADAGKNEKTKSNLALDSLALHPPPPHALHSAAAACPALMQTAASKISCGSIRQVDNQSDCSHQMSRKINRVEARAELNGEEGAELRGRAEGAELRGRAERGQS